MNYHQFESRIEDLATSRILDAETREAAKIAANLARGFRAGNGLDYTTEITRDKAHDGAILRGDVLEQAIDFLRKLVASEIDDATRATASDLLTAYSQVEL